jgi:autotransporter strand-loop-strand O-heptosyltransferase
MINPRDRSNEKRLSFKERKPRHWSLEGLEVLLHIDSFSLGETLCFSSFIKPFVEKYRPKKTIVSTFWPELFESEDFEFVSAASGDAMEVDKFLGVGILKNDVDHIVNGMMWASRNMLGISQDVPASRPPLKPVVVEKKKKVCIATESPKQAAKWSRPEGWNKVARHLLDLGFEVHNISLERGDEIEGVFSHHGNEDIMAAAKHINESALLVGLSGGLSWLAWGYGVPVVMISGFTKAHNEFDCYRVMNDRCCTGCHNVLANINSSCPIFANTSRANECHTTITPEMVIAQTENALKNHGWI